MLEKDIIKPIPVKILKTELNEDTFVRTTRKGDNEIYIVNQHNAPNTLLEIGRLREVTFRAAGGGTGEEIDLDDFDIIKNCYDQLIVWSPEDQLIIGGYRFIKCAKALNGESEEPNLSTAHYFNFTEKLKNEYLPKTIELGRSWVQPNYQARVSLRKGLYALDNIWDGLGALSYFNPEIDYFFGKVTMYPHFNTEARNFLLHFMHFYFPDKENLMQAKVPLKQDYDLSAYNKLLEGKSYKEGFKVLNSFLRERKENVPPLINIYMSLSPTMKTFGTAINPEFGSVEETGIMVTIPDIYEEKKIRHLEPLMGK